ncbi:hypothetical protein SAMN05216345_10457 [Cupriavidus sp. YR651]|nr:hypothetical protein [Cupriavidus sp. YR651]SDC82744.1 hypothetical protein SAMN05216345_10457 [Cupriavidus sp. YR651]
MQDTRHAAARRIPVRRPDRAAIAPIAPDIGALAATPHRQTSI